MLTKDLVYRSLLWLAKLPSVPEREPNGRDLSLQNNFKIRTFLSDFSWSRLRGSKSYAAANSVPIIAGMYSL